MGQSEKIFEPLEIKGLAFKNRILRSSIGGRTANWDGKVTEIWKNFELRFARGGIGGMISTTLNVHEAHKTPLQYPSIADDSCIPRLKKYIKEIKETGCRYIVQIGDPGYQAQIGLFPEEEDSISASDGFDLVYGYTNVRKSIDKVEGDGKSDPIEGMVDRFVRAAERVREAGADGLEITAAKGYIIQQFLNPAINRRNDRWGGDPDKRFEFLKQIVTRTRATLGKDFIIGLRIAAEDFNQSPRLFWFGRTPWGGKGNDIEQMLDYMQRVAADIDFIHVVSGFGFPSPRVTPGPFPTDEINIFYNHASHLSFKAGLRSVIYNLISRPVFLKQLSNRFIFQPGWEYKEAINLELASRFKNDEVIREKNKDLIVIANGGFQDHGRVEKALSDGDCDMVSMARALIANPDLLDKFWKSGNDPQGIERCSHCNRCVGRTPTSPLGCYDINRFQGTTRKEQVAAMVSQIEAWNQQDPLPGEVID